MTQPTHRVVAGLAVPLALVPTLIEAFREEYPSITDSIEDDEAAVRAVLKYLTTQILVTNRIKKVTATARGQVEAAQEEAEAQIEAAQREAVYFTSQIKDSFDVVE